MEEHLREQLKHPFLILLWGQDIGDTLDLFYQWHKEHWPKPLTGGMILFWLTSYSPSLREVWVGTQGRNHGEMLLAVFLTQCLTSFTCRPGPSAQAMMLTPVGWTFLHQVVIKDNHPQNQQKNLIYTVLQLRLFVSDDSSLYQVDNSD